MVYLATGGISLGIFIFASFWIYHYVDLDNHEVIDETALEAEAAMLREFNPLQF